MLLVIQKIFGQRRKDSLPTYMYSQKYTEPHATQMGSMFGIFVTISTPSFLKRFYRMLQEVDWGKHFLKAIKPTYIWCMLYCP